MTVDLSTSYELVSDESEHTVELLSERQNFTLRVDGGISRSMVNAGEQEYLDVDTPLFLGGVPPDVARHAHDQWHLRNTSSFRGNSVQLQHYVCLSVATVFSLHVNQLQFTFAKEPKSWPSSVVF